MISPRKPPTEQPKATQVDEGCKSLRGFEKPRNLEPQNRGHRHPVHTFSQPPSTTPEFFAVYYCAEDDDSPGGSMVSPRSNKGNVPSLPPALQVSPTAPLSSVGGRGKRPTPRKRRVGGNALHSGNASTTTEAVDLITDWTIADMKTASKNGGGTGVRFTLGGTDSTVNTQRPTSAKWETEQSIILQQELSQHVKAEREKEVYIRAHSLHRKPQRRLICKPAPKPPVMGVTAFGTCFSKDSGRSRNDDGGTAMETAHEDAGVSPFDSPDESVVGHVKYVTTSPRKAARAPESRTIVMYGGGPSASTRTSGTNNVPRLPQLPQSARGAFSNSLTHQPPNSTAPAQPLSRQLRLLEAEKKRKVLKPAVTPDLPDTLWEGDLTQLDAFERIHHQLNDITVPSNDVHHHHHTESAGNTTLHSPSLNPLRSPNSRGGSQRGIRGAAAGSNPPTSPGSLGGGGYRLDMSLGETMIPYGPNDSVDPSNPPARKRDYQLIKAVFRATMLQDTYPCRMMRALGGAEVLRRHEEIVQRYGYKRLNRDDFHYQIIEILRIPQHTIDRKDTNMMFDAFDTSLCGYVSEREFEQGIHWVMQGPDERRRIVASYCKHFLSARNVMEAVVSLLEIDMMLNALVETCEGRFLGVKEDAAGIKARLEPLMRHGTVPFPLFYEAVSKSRLIGRVVRMMQPNGTLPQTFEQTSGPDPNREVGTLAVSIDNLQFAEGTMFQSTGGTGGGILDSAGRKVGREPGGSSLDGAQRGSTSGAVIPSGDPSASKPSAGGGLVDLTHPRFKADLAARPPEYRPTPEHEDAKWCLRNGIVWKE